MKIAVFFLIPIMLAALFMTGGIFPFNAAKDFRIPGLPIINPNDQVSVVDKGNGTGLSTLQMGAMQALQRQCQAGQNLAVDLLLDVSSSMAINGGKKLKDLKASTIAFGNKLSPNDAIGVQTFSNSTKDIIPMNKYSVIGSTFSQTINKVKEEGGTPTQRGLAFARERMEANFINYPGYNKVFMLLTDGCPDDKKYRDEILNQAKAIKDDGIRVITVGIELGNAGKCDDWGGAAGAKQLMQQIASSPDDYYDAGSSGQLDAIYQSISKTFGSCSATIPTPTTVAAAACPLGKQPPIDMLLDVSGSMEPNMDSLKTSVGAFVDQVPLGTTFGIQDFSGGGPRGSARETVAIGPLGDKTSVKNAVNGLSEDQDGYTYMKDGFSFAKQKIDASGVNKNDLVFVFLSDGKPETKDQSQYDASQDPSGIAAAIKSSGTKIVTIALGSKADRSLMQKLASPNLYFDAPSAGDLATIYQQVNQAINCH